MQKLLISSLLLTALSSCAGDNGDVDAIQRPKLKTDSVNQTVACLKLDGEFARVDSAKDVIKLATKVEDGKTSYQIVAGKDFIVADGKDQPQKAADERGNLQSDGSIKITCSEKSVEVLVTQESAMADSSVHYATAKYTLEGEKLTIVATGDLKSLSGVYAKVKAEGAKGEEKKEEVKEEEKKEEKKEETKEEVKEEVKDEKKEDEKEEKDEGGVPPSNGGDQKKEEGDSAPADGNG